MYRHFASKEALLEAAVSEQLERIARGLAAIDDTTAGDPLDALMALGRWFLAELDAAEPLFRVLEQDGARMPEVRDTIRANVIDEGHARVSRLIRSRAGSRSIDADAIAAMIIGPLANHRRTSWTFGAPPLAIDDERLLRAWHQAIAALVLAARSDDGNP
jgi:AcrR family transcriptional regulator